MEEIILGIFVIMLLIFFTFLFALSPLFISYYIYKDAKKYNISYPYFWASFILMATYGGFYFGIIIPLILYFYIYSNKRTNVKKTDKEFFNNETDNNRT